MNLAVNIDDRLYNMECGNFNAVQSIQTHIDRRLDAASDTEGQLLEKLISGRYLGEIVRLTVLDTAEREDAFRNLTTPNSVPFGPLGAPYAFTTEALSDIAHDTSEDLSATAMLLRSLGAGDTTYQDRHRLREICIAAARRSARLVAAAIHATATYADPDLDRPHLVAADGSLFRGYPGYQRQVETALSQLAPRRASGGIRVAYIRESSGLGAAILAATAATANDRSG